MYATNGKIIKICKWYSEHKYILSKDDSLELDKDIKVIGNKIYSPDTCLLLPHRLNTIVLDRKMIEVIML